jgi:hypothetical protein
VVLRGLIAKSVSGVKLEVIVLLFKVRKEFEDDVVVATLCESVWVKLFFFTPLSLLTVFATATGGK